MRPAALIWRLWAAGGCSENREGSASGGGKGRFFTLSREGAAMTLPLRTFKGSCHCGALGFSFQTTLPVAKWSVRACQCRFCRAHGALTTSESGGRLMFHVSDVALLQRYRFSLKTADFLLCRRCGVYMGAQIETAHGAFGIINTLTMMPVPEGLPHAALADYSSETSDERLERREKRWTPLEKVV